MPSSSILSAGVDAGEPVVLHYEPEGSALDQIPTSRYDVSEVLAERVAGFDDAMG